MEKYPVSFGYVTFNLYITNNVDGFRTISSYGILKYFDDNKVIKPDRGTSFTKEKAETIITYLSMVFVLNFSRRRPGYGNNYQFL